VYQVLFEMVEFWPNCVIVMSGCRIEAGKSGKLQEATLEATGKLLSQNFLRMERRG
jgi:hypothetical protein